MYDNLKVILNLFLRNAKTANEKFDTDMMAKEFTINFNNHILSVGQTLLFQLPEKPLMCIIIKSIEGINIVLNAILNYKFYNMDASSSFQFLKV